MHRTAIVLYGSILLAALSMPAAAATGMNRSDPPENVILQDIGTTPVAFDHALHASYAACVECHHHTTGDTPSDPVCRGCHRSATRSSSVSCRECHPIDRYSPDYLEYLNTTTRYHIDIPGLKGAYHLNCIACHETIGTGPTACDACHSRESWLMKY